MRNSLGYPRVASQVTPGECVAQDSVVVVLQRNVAGLVRVEPVQVVGDTREWSFAARALVEQMIWRSRLWW